MENCGKGAMLEDSNFLEYQSKGKRGQEFLTIGHLNFLYLLYVLNILPACMYMPLEARIGFRSPETGVLGSCELVISPVPHSNIHFRNHCLALNWMPDIFAFLKSGVLFCFA